MNDILAERELVLYCLNAGDDFKDFYLDSNATIAYNNTNYTINYQGKNIL